MTFKKPNMDAIVNELKEFCDDFIINGKWYEWYEDDNPYDSSGDVRPLTTSKIDYMEDVEVHEQLCALHYIYTGERTPTYESGCGWNHTTLYWKYEHLLDQKILGGFIAINLPEGVDKESYKDNHWDEWDVFTDDICESDDYFHCLEQCNLESYYSKEKILELLRATN
jgi:hypothetical protein